MNDHVPVGFVIMSPRIVIITTTTATTATIQTGVEL
jgi:hypothetical protein